MQPIKGDSWFWGFVVAQSIAPIQPRFLVGMATYNEMDNLPRLLDAIRDIAPQAHLLIVDDHSPDGTGAYADQQAAADERVHVIHRAGKLGLGSAILTAMRFAIAQKYDFYVNMDADFSHHPRYLPAMMANAPSCDVVIGSRYIPGGGVENWPLSRRFISGMINVVSRVLLHLHALDVSGGYRCYRVAKLAEIDLEGIWSRGYSFQEEMIYRLSRRGCRVAEVPIVFADRRGGRSKLNWKESVRSLGVLLALGAMAFYDEV